MQLHFLGRGAAFYPQQGSTSAYILEENRLFLLDCGESVFAELLRRGVLSGVTAVYVALSHLHSDHCGSLGSLSHYCRYAMNAPLFVVVPDEPAYCSDVKTLLRLFGAPEGGVSLLYDRDVTGFSSFSSFRYVPTRHVSEIPSHSFVFETPEGGVFYSADTCTEEPCRAFMQTHPHFEHIYMDVTDAEYPGNVHLPLSVFARLIRDDQKARVSLMHVNSESCIAEGEALGFSVVSALPPCAPSDCPENAQRNSP